MLRWYEQTAHDGGDNPSRNRAPGRGPTVQWGKVAAAWDPALPNQVFVTRCLADGSATEAMAAMSLAVYLEAPGNVAGLTNLSTVPAAPPAVGDIVAFVSAWNPAGAEVCGVMVGKAGSPAGTIFAVKVWQDGGTTDGDLTTPCDRTYTARTLAATAIGTGGTLLGAAKAPEKTRWAQPVGKQTCPPASGGGVIGTAYLDAAGAFHLFDANEVQEQC
jgi:hypothetical protein